MLAVYIYKTFDIYVVCIAYLVVKREGCYFLFTIPCLHFHCIYPSSVLLQNKLFCSELAFITYNMSFLSPTGVTNYLRSALLQYSHQPQVTEFKCTLTKKQCLNSVPQFHYSPFQYFIATCGQELPYWPAQTRTFALSQKVQLETTVCVMYISYIASLLASFLPKPTQQTP